MRPRSLIPSLLALTLAACSPSDPASKRVGDPPSSVDLTDFDRRCMSDADCQLVHPDPCSHCGCASAPIAAREHERYITQRDALVCPEVDPEHRVDCGGCPGFRAVCKDQQCAAEMY
ncbi:MAG: hypothetical protein H6713_17450 [Myxococcales bacterium]|nr:hypothetical protein [Myxococcales bacterium]